MARYIDADILLKKMPNDLPYKASVKRVLMQAPDADVVEVVRCKDCIYSKKYNYLESEERCMCERKFVRHGIYKKPAMLEVSKDDFCSYGERRS